MFIDWSGNSSYSSSASRIYHIRNFRADKAGFFENDRLCVRISGIEIEEDNSRVLAPCSFNLSVALLLMYVYMRNEPGVEP
jgi:hypothetical protein